MNLLFAFFCSFCPSAACADFSHFASAGFPTTTVLPLLPVSLPVALASLTLCVLLSPVLLFGRSSTAASNGLKGRSIVMVNARKALRLPRDGNWSCSSKSAGSRSAKGKRAGCGLVYACLDLELWYLLPLLLLTLLGGYGCCGKGGISSLPLRDPAVDVFEAERLDEEKLDVMLAMLNLRMTWFAEPRICSDRPTVMPV